MVAESFCCLYTLPKSIKPLRKLLHIWGLFIVLAATFLKISFCVWHVTACREAQLSLQLLLKAVLGSAVTQQHDATSRGPH